MTECPTVSTSTGLVKGKISKPTALDGKEVFNFLSIPYGKSTGGKRRFLPPEKAEAWDGVFLAVETLVNCPQDVERTEIHDRMLPFNNRLNHDYLASTEDCLRLSVFTPRCQIGAGLPVMVWITGGGYQRNTAGRRDGTALAGMNDVIVVVVNFRVNLFGFLSLGQGSKCAGNMGLHDVVLALKWVKDEIAVFGGDPRNVTLFGESSGAGMVHILMMSPRAKGLFHKAILQSGTATSAAFIDKDPVTTRKNLVALLNLENLDETEVLEKLQAMPAQDLINVYNRNSMKGKEFMPIIDDCILPANPEDLVRAGKVHQVPIVIGCNDTEAGALLSNAIFSNYFSTPQEEEVKAVFSAVFSVNFPNVDVNAAYEMLKSAYLREDGGKSKYIRMHSDMMADAVFVVPIVLAAAAHGATGQATYLYHMCQRPDFNHSPANGRAVMKKLDFESCDHADDLHFVWGVPFAEGPLNHADAYFTEEEAELSRATMRYFTNFARSGNPNKGVKMETEWPRYVPTGEGRCHLSLKIPIEVGENLALDRIPLFAKLFSTSTR